MKKFDLKKGVVVLILCLGYFNFTQAQSWEYHYNSSANIVPISVFENTITHTLFTSGVLDNALTNKRDGFIIELDSNGVLLRSKEIHINGYTIYILGFAGSDSVTNTYSFIGMKSDTVAPYLTSFSSFLLDSNLNLIATKENYIPIGSANAILYTNYSKNKNFIITGQIYDTLNNSLNVIYTFKHNGDSLIATTFNNFPYLFIYDCISDEQTGGYKAISEPYQWTKARIFYFDSLLVINHVDTVTFFQNLSHTNSGKYSFKDLDDSTYIIAGGYYKFLLNTTNQDVSLSKIKTSTNTIISEKSTGRPVIEKPATYRALDFIDKNNIYLGAISNYTSPFGADSNYIMLTNFDSNLNIKWQRFIGGDATYSLYTVLATHDGGCVLTTTTYDAATASYPGQSNAIIFKIDSLGTLTNIKQNKSFNVRKYLPYPNPSPNKFKLAGFINTTIKIEFFDITSKLVLSEKIYSSATEINTDKLGSGIYLYKISDKDYIETGKWVKE